MMQASSLDVFLDDYCAATEPRGRNVAEVVRALARAAVSVRATIRMGALGGHLAAELDTANSGGDTQRHLDLHADDTFLAALRDAPVALYASEELESVIEVDPAADIAVAIDPLDGSSNIDTNTSIGTIFSLLPVVGAPGGNPNASFRQPGRNQLGAGFFIYGAQFALVLTLGAGTHIFVYSERSGRFQQAYSGLQVAPRASEFAINMSNYRHWEEAVRLYVDDCLKGAGGPRERDFNMRWTASLVAEAYRILMRGGVFLYPADGRRGYAHGRLRLVYEANPVAMLVEQAGGGATDTVNRILDLKPANLHQRTPLVFGAAREVARVGRYHLDPSRIGERAPLFGSRGLFRA